MSANSSNLSPYGYDIVVATTQASINATMKQYLYDIDTGTIAMPEVVMCYLQDNEGNPQYIDYNTLKQQANGSDPFAVPDGADPNTNTDLQNLNNAGFWYGFKARVGLPPGILPTKLPNIITVGNDITAVSYNLMCSELVVVEATFGRRGIIGWLNKSQPQGDPWLFNSKVNLNLVQSTHNLPPAVQNAVNNLGGNAFSVQQLLFDLDTAMLQTPPTIPGVDPGTPLYTALQTVFMGAYFNTLKTNTQPVLGYAITQTPDPSSLALTALNLEVDPYVGTDGKPVANPTPDQIAVSTLNYLCATGGDPLPAVETFPWNWVEIGEETDFHGAISVKRNTFATVLANQLLPSLQPNCYLIHVTDTLTSLGQKFGYTVTPGQTPTITITSDPPSQILNFSWTSTSSDQAGDKGAVGKISATQTYTVTVSVASDTMTIVQSQVIYLSITSLATTASGNIVDRTLTDTYSLAVDSNGQVQVTRTDSQTTDTSQNIDVSGFVNFFVDINGTIDGFTKAFTDLVSGTLQDLPIASVQGFIFPGGNTFAFKDLAFSDNQDLVAHITYLAPS